jgi:hypothetical protein
MSRYSDYLRLPPSVEINVLNTVDGAVAQLEKNLRSVSNQIILKYGGMANGVGQMATDIKERAQPGTLKVLRIWSHGYPGAQAVSFHPKVSPKGQRAGISVSNYFQVQPALAQLSPYFARGGRAELRGCSVMGGYDGVELLTTLARLWHVDVYGAVSPQDIGPIDWCGLAMRVTPQGNTFKTSGIPIGH